MNAFESRLSVNAARGRGRIGQSPNIRFPWLSDYLAPLTPDGQLPTFGQSLV